MDAPPTLAGMPLSALHAGWRAAMAALPDADRGRLIAEADTLYGGSRDDRRRALSCWLAFRDRLDPAAPADVPRILALFLGVPPGLEDLGPLARRAEASLDPDLRGAASMFLGRVDGDEGRLASAETRFRTVLTANRGTGSLVEYLACSSLATLCLRGNREFEALVLARRLAANPGPGAEETRLRFARMMLVGALVRLREWDHVRDVIEAIDRSLDGRALPYERTVRFNVHTYAARRALAMEDPDAAAREVEAAAEVEKHGQSLEAEPRTLLLLRARCAEAAGRFPEAEAFLVEATSIPGPRAVSWLEVLGDLVLCRLETSGKEAGLEAARSLLDVLESGGVAAYGTGQVLAAASGLGALLRARCGDVPEAHRAFDAGAEAALLRIREIDRCLRDVPELAAIEPGDEHLLHRHRLLFVREHRTLLDHVKDRLLAEGGPGTMAPFRRDGDLFRVCAWCSRILGIDGKWIPVAHYLPLGPDLPVSHGICPPCALSFNRT